MVIGRPMINDGESFSSCHINYSMLMPSLMISPITVTGGVNKCWGQTATYIADTDLLVGRIVSLADQPVNTDNVNGLKIGYLKIGAAIVPSNHPIGVTQHNCLAGESMEICIQGYTTCISIAGDATPERGSVALAGADIDFGKIRLGVPAAAVQARVGFVAQSNPIVVNGPALVFYQGYFQST